MICRNSNFFTASNYLKSKCCRRKRRFSCKYPVQITRDRPCRRRLTISVRWISNRVELSAHECAGTGDRVVIIERHSRQNEVGDLGEVQLSRTGLATYNIILGSLQSVHIRVVTLKFDQSCLRCRFWFSVRRWQHVKHHVVDAISAWSIEAGVGTIGLVCNDRINIQQGNRGHVMSVRLHAGLRSHGNGFRTCALTSMDLEILSSSLRIHF